MVNPLSDGFIWANIKINLHFNSILPIWNITDCWDLVSRKLRTSPVYMVNIMAADELVTQGTRASAAWYWPHSLRLLQTQGQLIYPPQIHFHEQKKLCIAIRISLKVIPNGLIDNKSALVQVMAWCPTGDKPLPEPLLTSSLMHICCTRGRWVKTSMRNLADKKQQPWESK